MDSVPTPRAVSRFAWLQTWPGFLTTGFAAIILFIALGYVEENWRGERIWQLLVVSSAAPKGSAG